MLRYFVAANSWFVIALVVHLGRALHHTEIGSVDAAAVPNDWVKFYSFFGIGDPIAARAYNAIVLLIVAIGVTCLGVYLQQTCGLFSIAMRKWPLRSPGFKTTLP